MSPMKICRMHFMYNRIQGLWNTGGKGDDLDHLNRRHKNVKKTELPRF